MTLSDVTALNPTSHIYCGATTSYAGMITSLRSKYMISGHQPTHADNQRAGNTLSHMQTGGYRWKYKYKYAIIDNMNYLKQCHCRSATHEHF